MTKRKKNKIRRAYILRGISGSGKTTHARVITALEHERAGRIVDVKQFSADDFFVGRDGQYRFDPRRLGDAHAQCMRKFEAAVLEGTEVVICDNTNTTAEEFGAYARLADIHGYDVRVVTVYRDPVVCSEQQRHAVPPQVVFDQYRRLLAADIPRRWNPETVFHH